jgi:3-oxoacyl-ACP reductase-like protein
MLCIMLLNTTVVSSEQGVSVSFGGAGSAAGDIQLDQALVEFAQRQDAQFDALEARLAARQDSNNIQLLEAVLEQSQQATADNMDRLYAYFEQQRLQDLQAMRAGYEELVDSDYQTISSLRQLAQYVSFEADLP